LLSIAYSIYPTNKFQVKKVTLKSCYSKASQTPPDVLYNLFIFKDIGYILLLKNGLKKICRKNYKNHLRSNNYELHVCTAVALCFPNSLDVMVLENINLSSDRIGRPSLWSNFLSSIGYIHCQQCIFQLHVNFISTWT
jgi:hypothetical protein